ncbi:MAG TPA: hypothetical protein VN625_02400 [Desulfuromonadaceae bacterium]|nr:hypothetical protein [Desulfuromonadaceae bacterium]
MTTIVRSALLGLIIFAWTIQCSFAGGTYAAMPYKDIRDLFEPTMKIDQSKLEVRVYFSSTNKAVSPSEIRLEIHSATKGIIPVLLDTNGQLITFPIEKELLGENPPVVANQPAGTVKYSITRQMPLADQLTFRYRRLGDCVNELNKAIKTQIGTIGSLFVPRADTVEFIFPKSSAGKAKVEIAAAAGKKEFTADEYGVVAFKLEQPLLAENPEVKVSEKPDHIVPELPRR